MQGRGVGGIAFLRVCTIPFPSLQPGGFPICWPLVPLLSGPQRLTCARFPQSCARNAKVLQNQMFLLAPAVYQIPIRSNKFLRRAPAQQFIASFRLRRVRCLTVSSHPGRKELFRSSKFLKISTLYIQTRKHSISPPVLTRCE